MESDYGEGERFYGAVSPSFAYKFMTNEEAIDMLEKVSAQLGEHFDAVQIMATWRPEEGGTALNYRGCGNWYARQGMAHEFIQANITKNSAERLANKIRPEE